MSKGSCSVVWYRRHAKRCLLRRTLPKVAASTVDGPGDWTVHGLHTCSTTWLVPRSKRTHSQVQPLPNQAIHSLLLQHFALITWSRSEMCIPTSLPQKRNEIRQYRAKHKSHHYHKSETQRVTQLQVTGQHTPAHPNALHG